MSVGVKWGMGWVVVGTAVFGVPRFWTKTLWAFIRDLVLDLSGTESVILSQESSDSESCDSNRAIPRSL